MGETLNPLHEIDWFEEYSKGDNLLCFICISVVETVLGLLIESRLHLPYKYHLMVVPLLIKFICKKQIGYEAGLVFTIPVGILFWRLG